MEEEKIEHSKDGKKVLFFCFCFIAEDIAVVGSRQLCSRRPSRAVLWFFKQLSYRILEYQFEWSDVNLIKKLIV